MVFGTRFPTLAFYTGGVGQSSDGVPQRAHESFCREAARIDAKIADFNEVSYSSAALPKELFGRIYPIEKCAQFFKAGAVLETISARAGTPQSKHRAIATGIGVCWGKDDSGALLCGVAAKYVEYFNVWIDAEIAQAHATLWLNKSLKNSLSLRGIKRHSDFLIYNNFVNIEHAFGYSLTALGFLNFEYADAVVIK